MSSASPKRSAVIAMAVAGLGLAGVVFLRGGTGTEPRVPVPEPAATASAPAGPAGPIRHPVVLLQPDRPPRVAVGGAHPGGAEVRVACGTCHATMRPGEGLRDAALLKTFHQGLRYEHGGLTCLSCHNASDYDSLRLADGARVAFTDAMTLCSQCHGPQRRDYDRGLHGGMNGHWDLTRGGRERHACVHCHDPHAPAFPVVLPVLPPRDRVLVPPPARSSVPH